MITQKIMLYNSLKREKEEFIPLNAPFVGLYVCGPTVYGDPHLGHARPAVTFDLVFRYLKHCGYKVRYVRNITDVGHLVNDADEGEDKIAKKALIEKLEPMEIAQQYIYSYHDAVDALNVLRPSIEPRASGHIIEQIKMVESIINAGFAYIVNGSVYFDVEKYSKTHNYGILSGRVVEELLSNTRDLEGQEEKHHPADFALWKKAQPEHIMRWESPWSIGFPGWHLECSAMSSKYLGNNFDIHGGGMDLLFPHHECEIAQSVAANGFEPVKYWMHNNMITINGQKMGKSLNNFITLNEFFHGSHPSLSKPFSPMTIRFFILQAHYRSTLDFSNDALLAAEKGFKKMMHSFATIKNLKASRTSSSDIKKLHQQCYDAMNDDFNSPVLMAQVFEAVRIINSVNDNSETISAEDLELLKKILNDFVVDVLGLKEESVNTGNQTITELMNLIIQLRQNARTNKDYAASDKIREELAKLNISLKDTKDGIQWNFDN